MQEILQIELTKEQVSHVKSQLEERNLFKTSQALQENNFFEKDVSVVGQIEALGVEIEIKGYIDDIGDAVEEAIDGTAETLRKGVRKVKVIVKCLTEKDC